MPKYLTLSDDLQLKPGNGGQFLSKSHKTLEQVESEVERWLEEHPNHPKEPLVTEWLTLTSEYREEQKRDALVEAAAKDMKTLQADRTTYYLRRGMSLAEASEKAAKYIRAVAAKTVEDL